MIASFLNVPQLLYLPTNSLYRALGTLSIVKRRVCLVAFISIRKSCLGVKHLWRSVVPVGRLIS